MEIVGGFMVMMSIISLFLAVVWLVMPFVVFAVKEKQERTLKLLESLDRRLTGIEMHLSKRQSAVTESPVSEQTAPSAGLLP